jgi:hypothetical protein
MMVSARERSTSYSLRWSLNVPGAGAGGADPLTLEYEIEAIEELYVADRPWDFDREGKIVPDPFGIHRYVRDGSLRLALAKVPYPSNLRPFYKFFPYSSRVAPGATHRGRVQVSLPVDEYSPLARDVSSPTADEFVSTVYFVLAYRLGRTLDAPPAPPPGYRPEDVGYDVPTTEQMISSVSVDPLRVKRRVGPMPRLALPGEPPPGPVPIPALDLAPEKR